MTTKGEQHMGALVRLCSLLSVFALAVPGCSNPANRFCFTTDALRSIDTGTSGWKWQIRDCSMRVRTSAGTCQIPQRFETIDRIAGPAGRSGHFEQMYDSEELLITVSWDVAERFAERSWTLRHRQGKPFHVIDVCERIAFDQSFERIDLHTDGSEFRVPVNLFLRGRQMSMAVGVTYPWVDLAAEGNNGATASYAVEADVVAGETFRSERFFIVPCPYVGAVCDKAGGTTRILQLDRKEPMDYGEVLAMQDYVAHYLPECPLPEDGFFVWVNGWWVRASNGWKSPQQAIDRIAECGIHDIMLPEVWWGYGEHPVLPPRLRDLKPGERLPIPDDTARLIAYARDKGVHIGSFCCPSNGIFGKPEWKAVDAAGKEYIYLPSIEKNGYNCLANRSFVDAFTQLQLQMIADSGTRFWAWDGRTLSFDEVDWPGHKPDVVPCYGTGHGHLPGRQFWQEYHNVQSMIERLREENPRACLQSYWGLKRGTPWIMRGLNAIENYYEVSSIHDQRLQNWYNNQYRFLPAYMNWVNLGDGDPRAFETDLITAISSATHVQFGAAYKGLDRPENVAALRKWKAFADENRRFLSRKRDLFGQPGSTWVTGSAHCIDDRGYLFLFRTQAERPSGAMASVPLNEWIGLRSGGRYRIERIYPGRQVLAVVERGGTIELPVTAPAEVYRIEPTQQPASAPSEPDTTHATATVRTLAFPPGSILAVRPDAVQGCR
jgi:hypothetical protein